MRLLPVPVLLLLITACEPVAPVSPDPDSDPDTTDVDTDTGDSAWRFEAVDGMVCGGGTPTGVGINEGTDPNKLLVLLAGGGACWDGVSCFVVGSASHIEGTWGAAQLASEVAVVDGTGLLDRSNTDSPLHDATWVYVPYCTGDLHMGDAVQQHDPFNPSRDTHHKGAVNLSAALDRLSTAQPSLDTLWVLGLSAGGYGAQLQAHRFDETWPDADLRIFADGAPMVHPWEGRWGLWRSAWNAQLPPDCTGCDTSMPAVLGRQAAALPDASFALATSANDSVITLYFARPVGGLSGAIDALIHDHYGSDRLSAFRVPGTDHVLLGNPAAYTAPDGTALDAWFDLWVRGEPLPDAL